jgi:hypothetical protein
VTDIFREVEEEVRRERLAQLWKQYSDYIIAGAALIVIAVAGYQLWRVYDQREHVKASDEYSVAQQFVESGQSGEAASLFAKLAKSAPGGYAAVSRLQEADALLAAGNRAEAVGLYRQIAAGNDPYLAAVARIHLGWALVDQSPKADVEAVLAPLDAPASAWQPMAHEILAYADYRAGNIPQALREYKILAADGKTPPALRKRSGVMAAFLTAGGDKDYGTVPQPQPSKAQPIPLKTGTGGSPSK